MAKNTFTFGEYLSCSRVTWGSSVPETRTLCRFPSPLTWKDASSLKMKHASNSSFSICRITRQSSYRMVKSSHFRAWTNRSLYGFISKHTGFWRRLFVEAATHDSLSALIFVGYVRSKTQHGPQLHRTQRAHQDLWILKCNLYARISCMRRKWYSAGWFSVKLCAECKLHSCCRNSSPTAEHANSSAVSLTTKRFICRHRGDISFRMSGGTLHVGASVHSRLQIP